MNRPHEIIQAILQERQISQNAAAAELEADKGHFSRIARGIGKPGRKLTNRMYHWSKGRLPPDIWDLYDVDANMGES